MTSSVSSSESTGAAFASSSSGGGAPALIAASVAGVRHAGEAKRVRVVTLLFGLVLLLVRGEQDVVRLRAAEDGALCPHRVRFAGQGAGTEGVIRKLNTALFLNIDRRY